MLLQIGHILLTRQQSVYRFTALTFISKTSIPCHQETPIEMTAYNCIEPAPVVSTRWATLQHFIQVEYVYNQIMAEPYRKRLRESSCTEVTIRLPRRL
jgi:hypothetical protein